VYGGVRCGLQRELDDSREITVLQAPKFKVESTETIWAEGVDAVAVYLVISHDPAPERVLPFYAERANKTQDIVALQNRL
jgi:hypothetical protein